MKNSERELGWSHEWKIYEFPYYYLKNNGIIKWGEMVMVFVTVDYQREGYKLRGLSSMECLLKGF